LADCDLLDLLGFVLRCVCCDFGGIDLLGVATVTREIRAAEYRRRVSEKRRIKATYQIIMIEMVLAFVSILLLLGTA
jgi:hypothetical protein